MITLELQFFDCQAAGFKFLRYIFQRVFGHPFHSYNLFYHRYNPNLFKTTASPTVAIHYSLFLFLFIWPITILALLSYYVGFRNNYCKYPQQMYISISFRLFPFPFSGNVRQVVQASTTEHIKGHLLKPRYFFSRRATKTGGGGLMRAATKKKIPFCFLKKNIIY